MKHNDSTIAPETQAGIKELSLQEINEVGGGNAILRWAASSAAWDVALHLISNINVSQVGDPMDTKLGIGPTYQQQ